MTITNPCFSAPRLALAGTAAALAAAVLTTGSATAAGSSSATVANDTLTITGTNHGDRVVLRLAGGEPGILEVDFGDDGSAEHSLDRSTFSRVEVILGSGDDHFRVDQVNGSFADEALTVDGGSGDDTLLGGAGAELFIGGSGHDFIDGNQGADTALMGPGADTFRWDPGDGSDVVEGESGTDTLVFNGSGANEAMRLFADGGRSVFFRDIGNIRMDTDEVERLAVAALGGADTINIDGSGTDLRQVDIDLSGTAGGGDEQPDVVIVNGTAGADNIDVDAVGGRVDVSAMKTDVRISGGELIDTLRIDALGGNDDVDVAGAVLALIDVVVDLGADQR